MAKTSKKGTWGRALLSLFGSILFIMTIRWASFEPYVIPSGSMIPNLLIHDFILVNKMAYGIRIPFTKNWLLKYDQPQRGEVVVFRSKDKDSYFLVKRVVGLPGDTLEFSKKGDMRLNGEVISFAANDEAQAWIMQFIDEYEKEEFAETYAIFGEETKEEPYLTIREKDIERSYQGPYEVPDGHMMVVGDNRDNSVDSRSYGFVPLENVLGRAMFIWMSCSETLEGAQNVCHPAHLRWNRIFKRVN